VLFDCFAHMILTLSSERNDALAIMIRPMPIPLHPSDNSGRRRPAVEQGAVIGGSGKLFDVSEKSFRSIQLDDIFYAAASAEEQIPVGLHRKASRDQGLHRFRPAL
jgi:hypothetical protein